MSSFAGTLSRTTFTNSFNIYHIACLWTYLMLCISNGLSPTQIMSTNTSINHPGDNDDDPLAEDVDWISAVSGCVIVLSIAAAYACYVIHRKRKEDKRKQNDQQIVLMSNKTNKGQQTQLEDFQYNR